MNRNAAISKVIRIIIYVISFFILIFIFWGIWLNFYFNKKLIELVKEQVSVSTNNEYALSLDGLSINLFTHTIRVNNLIIASPNRKSHSKAKYVFKAKVLQIIDFSVISYLRTHDLSIDRIEFEEPQISIFQGFERLPQKKDNAAYKNISLYAVISKKLNSISIAHIDILNSQFNIYKNGTDTLSVFSTNDNSISIKNFSVNQETDKKNRLFVAEKFEIVMNTFSYHLGNGLYSLYGKSLFASYIDSTLVIDSLQVVPNFSKKEFADEAGRQTSRAKISTSKLSCKKMDVKLFFEYNWLVIHKMELTGCAIDVFRDNTLPLAPVKRPSLQAMVKGLPFFVSVDTIEMINGRLAFEVQNPGAAATGKISINKMNILITGVQNDSSTFTGQENIKAVVNGSVLNQGRFTETYTFPLKETKELFYCSGSMTSMPMTSFNSLIQPTKQITIKSGQLDFVSFSFVAHENSSTGTMKFLYHDLKLEVMDKEDGKSRLKEKVKTFLTNKLVIQESNPGKDGMVRISNIHAEHNPHRFFLNYSMLSVLSGIVPAVKNEKRARMLQKKK